MDAVKRLLAGRIGQAVLGAALALGLQLGYVSAACHADLVAALSRW